MFPDTDTRDEMIRIVLNRAKWSYMMIIFEHTSIAKVTVMTSQWLLEKDQERFEVFPSQTIYLNIAQKALAQMTIICLCWFVYSIITFLFIRWRGHASRPSWYLFIENAKIKFYQSFHPQFVRVCMVHNPDRYNTSWNRRTTIDRRVCHTIDNKNNSIHHIALFGDLNDENHQRIGPDEEYLPDGWNTSDAITKKTKKRWKARTSTFFHEMNSTKHRIERRSFFQTNI